MATRFEYNIGSHYCPKCNKYTPHLFLYYKGMDYCINILLLPLFFASIKKRLVCLGCNTVYKLNKNTKEFIKKFKKAGLNHEANYLAFCTEMVDFVQKEQNNFKINEVVDENILLVLLRQKIIWKYNLPEEWFVHFTYQTLESLNKIERIENKLYQTKTDSIEFNGGVWDRKD